MSKNIIKENLKSLDFYKSKNLEIAERLMKAYGGDIYSLDLLALGTLKRSLSLLSGFYTLIENENYTCAVSILRLQIDNCLRFYASHLVDNPHEFAKKVLEGKKIKNIRDKKNKKLYDSYLLEKFVERFPKYKWIEDVYKEASGFVHLSEKHIFATISKVGEKGMRIIISETDNHIHYKFYIEAIEALKSITDILFILIEGWIFTKNNPRLIEKLKNKRGNQ